MSDVEYRRLRALKRAPDDHVHLQDVGDAILGGAEGEQAELRDVDDDGRRVKRRQPAPALEREVDLAHALRERRGERCEGRLARNTVRAEPVTLLKAGERAGERRVEDGRGGVRAGGARRQIPERRQQAPQRRSAGVLTAAAQPRRRRRQLGERGIRGECQVALQRNLQKVVVVEGRLDGGERRGHVARTCQALERRREIERCVPG